MNTNLLKYGDNMSEKNDIRIQLSSAGESAKQVVLKKTTVVLLAFIVFMFNGIFVQAAGSAGFSLATSSGTVRVGDTVTITGRVTADSMIATFDLDVTYDPGVLQFKSAAAAGSVSGSELDIVAGTGRVQFLYLDDGGGTSGVTGGNIFSVSFSVIGGQPGASTNLGFSIRTAGDSTAQAMSASGSGTALSIAAPRSTNNNLSSLTVMPGGLSPAFAAGTKNYRLSVPYSVEKIQVQAQAQDSKAGVQINNPILTPGGATTVSVTVTADSGAQKTYSIVVSREQDPNYVPDSNGRLDSLSIEGFLLSPVFSSDQYEYVVYLPYEVTSLSVNASAASSKFRSVNISGQDMLEADKLNIISVAVTAEDESVTEYSIGVFRAAEFLGLEEFSMDGLNSETVEETTIEEKVETEPIETTVETTVEAVDNEDASLDSTEGHVSYNVLVLIIVVLLVVILAGGLFTVWYFVLRRKTNKS
jgi:hypothetical protein